MVEVPHACPKLGMVFGQPLQRTGIEQVLSKLANTSRDDIGHKDIFQLLASCSSELGELTDELLIKYKVFGTSGKTPDEGPRAEAIDLAISALAVYYAESNQEGISNAQADIDLAIIMGNKLNKWINSQMSESVKATMY